MKKHRFGPVVITEHSVMSRCMNGFCDMDLSYDVADVPQDEIRVAAQIVKSMQEKANGAFPCPFKKHEVLDRVVLN